MHHNVKRAQEIDRIQILTAAKLIRQPFAFITRIVQIEHGSHCIDTQPIQMKFGQPEIAIAFIPPIATTQALARLIGRPRAIRYLYDGKMASAAEALDWGLVDELVPVAELRARVQAYAEELAAKPAQALAAIRRTVTLGGGATFEEGMALELEEASALAASDDFREGVRAFLEKRPPQWRR